MIRLNRVTDSFIGKMDLVNIRDLHTIRNCISDYAYSPQNFSSGLWWVIFRIQNAFRSLFHCSDWDIACGTLQRGYLRIASTMKCHPLGENKEYRLFSFAEAQSAFHKTCHEAIKAIASLKSSRNLENALSIEQAARQNQYPVALRKEPGVRKEFQRLISALEGNTKALLLPESRQHT